MLPLKCYTNSDILTILIWMPLKLKTMEGKIIEKQNNSWSYKMESSSTNGAKMQPLNTSAHISREQSETEKSKILFKCRAC